MANELRREARRAIPLAGLCRDAMIATMPAFKWAPEPLYLLTGAPLNGR
jgi:hypothetical protein